MKAYLPIVDIVDGNSIENNLSQFLKAKFPMLLIEVGKVTEVNDAQLANALSPIFSILQTIPS